MGSQGCVWGSVRLLPVCCGGYSGEQLGGEGVWKANQLTVIKG